MLAASPSLWAWVLPPLMLVASNVFMTFAWYGHLKFPTAPLWGVVLISWGIAFFEYCIAVPANRLGHAVYSAAQLKTMQEVITFSVFVVFSATYLKEGLAPSQLLGFALIAGGAALVFLKP
ncbi:DMT family protein [Albimonas sp. CAU 1670]|uniref:DMT family protein n=1 Tax=Albimonas sp. CAU 1670 TaxID=3032599 RepID=UPI0023DA8270|nr:DMT family protein [Albimonas sp. CAU 1670]MDF2232054.1 DMT family protein [Albimonas sp. CAU 1670]